MANPESIEHQASRNILLLAETYCAAIKIGKAERPLKLSTLSRRAHGDPPFFDRLKADIRRYDRIGHRVGKRGSFTFRVYDQLIRWFGANWPADTEFPPLTDLHHKPRKEYHGKGQDDEGDAEKAKQAPQAASREGTEARDGSASDLLGKLRRSVDPV